MVHLLGTSHGNPQVLFFGGNYSWWGANNLYILHTSHIGYLFLKYWNCDNYQLKTTSQITFLNIDTITRNKNGATNGGEHITHQFI